MDTSAKPGKTYTYVVYPVRGSYTGYAAAKTITRLSTPVISSVKAAFGRKVTVTWNKAAGSPTHYMITYETGNRTSSIKVKASSLKTVNGKYTYTISNLGFWKNYKITVTALKGSYRSNASAARTVKVTR